MKMLPLLLLLGSPIPAQVVGARESFTQEENATSWYLYDFVNDPVRLDMHDDYEHSSIGDIYAFFTGDLAVSLFAFADSSSGYFVGDYTAVGIDSIECDIYIDDISTFDVAEFYIYAGGVEYYSEYFVIDTSGWSIQTSSFTKNQWYVYDEDEDVEIPITLTPEILGDIIEIGVNFFPLSDAADGQLVALDNFALLPDLTPPVLDLTQPTGEVTVSFERADGISYDLQMSTTLQDSDWFGLDGDTSDIRGEGRYEITITTRPKSFFRITTYPLYDDVP